MIKPRAFEALAVMRPVTKLPDFCTKERTVQYGNIRKGLFEQMFTI